VIDISSEWANTGPVYELGVSFVNAFVRGSGAWGERGAFQFAARRGYLDLVADAVSVGDEDFTPRYHDVFAALGYAITDTTSVDAHVLMAKDHVDYSSADEGENGESKSSQKYAWLTFDTEPNDRLRWVNIVSAGKVNNNDQGSAQNFPSEVIDRYYDRKVEISSLQSDLSLRLSDSQLLMFGLRWRHLEADFDYHIDSFRRSYLYNGGIPLVIKRDIITSSKGNEYGAYARYRFRPTAHTSWEIGVRWDQQTYTDTTDDTQLSPRLNGLIELGESTEVRLGWGYYYQPQGIQDLQVEDGITHYFPAERAEHWVAGIRHRFQSNLELQMDLYKKRYSDLRPRFENALDTFDYAAETDFDRVRIDPESAKSKGVEFTLRNRQSERFDWWFNYTWSKAEDIIGGVAVPRSWDQRHALTGNLTWHGERWALSVVGRYHSGWPQTPLLITPVLDAGDALIGVEGDLSQRNQANYDDYFRVDMRLSRTVGLKRGSFQFYLEIFNLLNSKNQCCVADHELAIGPPITASPNFDEFLPLFPSFGFVWTFGPGAG
jgi:outer membrane cobalamin receptor